MTSDKTLEQSLGVDDKCDVRWRDGKQSLRAKVVDRRPLNYRKRKGKGTSLPSVENLKPEEIEYYIHYETHDRYVETFTPALSSQCLMFSHAC